MKRVAIAAFLAGTALCGPALADQMDDVRTRLNAIEKENSSIRQENAALLENKRLHEQKCEAEELSGSRSCRGRGTGSCCTAGCASCGP